MMTVRDAADLLGERGTNRVQRVRRRLLKMGAQLVTMGEGQTLRYLVRQEDVDRLRAEKAERLGPMDFRILIEGLREILTQEFDAKMEALRDELQAELAAVHRARHAAPQARR
jgi:hypothetical protein